MKVIVGLGNPGARYAGTRHNVGYAVLEELGRRGSVGRPRQQFESEVGEIQVAGERVLLVAPLTFMNLSGRAIQPLLKFFQISPAETLVICDDLDLPTGRLRLRAGGSGGGQKGLQNIVQMLGTTEVPRLRLGIGRPPGQMDAADYVLGKFRGEELTEIEIAVQTAADAAECWVRAGLSEAMNRFNPKRDQKHGSGGSAAGDRPAS